MFTKYLKPEYTNSPEALEIAKLFGNTNTKYSMSLRVPVEFGDAITRFLKKAIDPKYSFNRRTGGGTRAASSMRLTCLRKDDTYFKYYFAKKHKKQPPMPPVTLPGRQCCGQII